MVLPIKLPGANRDLDPIGLVPGPALNLIRLAGKVVAIVQKALK